MWPAGFERKMRKHTRRCMVRLTFKVSTDRTSSDGDMLKDLN
jgi:hypothetical protein